MSIKDKLQIYIITYNRKKKLKCTLDSILSKTSPIRDFDITILDNASTDGTSELIGNYCKEYENLKHIRHNINIGGNANICRAFEMGASCGKDYFWVLCDDDKYDFSNWDEVVERMCARDNVICVCDYVFGKEENKTSAAYQIFQLTFVPAGIYKSSLITADVLVNMYDAILTMFQQAVVSIKCVNENKKIHVLSKPIVFNGLHFEDCVDNESLSYKRGGNEKWVMERRENTVWVLGFANIITLLKDKKLQRQCIEVSIPDKDIYGSWKNFNRDMIFRYITKGCANYFTEIYKVLPKLRQEYFDNFMQEGYNKIRKKITFKRFVQTIFSIKNSKDKRHKIITILGLKIKLRRHKKK